MAARSEPAVLALTRVKVREKRWVRARVHVFRDRIEVDTAAGRTEVDLARVSWVGVRAAWLTAVLVIVHSGGERLAISGLRRADAGKAHRTVVDLAARLHPAAGAGR